MLFLMSNRPPDPKNARNKNVLVVGGSGSGKTRFWLKPNLLQCHSSYVVTDPKGTIVLECGQAMLKNGYKVKVLNTINFKKSMHYNPFAYVHSEKDILKLVTTLMTNTKGEGSGGDPFWEKSERLLLTALIAYLHIHNLNSLIKVQFTLFSVLIHTVIVIDTVGYIRAFLDFSHQNAFSNAMHCSCRNKVGIALVNLNFLQMLIQRSSFNSFPKYFLGHLVLKTVN